jgi:hypothetical protein
MRLSVVRAASLAALLAILGFQQPPPQTVTPANFVAGVTNPYFPLTPGTTYIYEGEDEGVPIRNETTVTHETTVIQGVTCIVVHDLAYANGILVEDTFDWYAQDNAGNVWYFGEDTRELDEFGNVISTQGSWKAGVDGARAGYIMLANPQVHDQYYQEYAKHVAEDKARILALDGEVSVPYGDFEDVLVTREWSRLAPGAIEHKLYAPGIGLVYAQGVHGVDEFIELVSVSGP